MLADLRHSARSFARAPWLALALVISIAIGIGSNAAVIGFIRGFVAPRLAIPAIESVVALFGRDAQDGFVPVSYDHFLALASHAESFAWLGAAREQQSRVVFAEQSFVGASAAITPELAALYTMSFTDGVVISDRLWRSTFAGGKGARGRIVRIDDVDQKIGGVAPPWLEGLYAGREIDLWVPLATDGMSEAERKSRSLWVFGRLREGVSVSRAQVVLNDARGTEPAVTVQPYTGVTPEVAGGISRVAALLPAAAGVVLLLACVNVAVFLSARASARTHETSVRVALGATRGRIVRQLLADSVLIAVAGGAAGALVAVWTAHLVPAMFFVEDAEHLAFLPSAWGIAAATIACAAVTVACGLIPLIESRVDDPAIVLRREAVGPSPAMRRLRRALVVVEMTGCCLLIVATALLLNGFRTALRTSAGNRRGPVVLATVQPRVGFSRPDLGVEYYRLVENAALTLPGVLRTSWVDTLPGSRPSWSAMRFEPARSPMRDVVLDVIAFDGDTVHRITVPPVAGRMFGGRDTPDSCPVVMVNTEAADALFGGHAVGRVIEAGDGRQFEVIGEVGMRRPPKSPPSAPAAFFYADQRGTPAGRVGPTHFRVATAEAAAQGVLDTRVVSPQYFSSMDMAVTHGAIFARPAPPMSCRSAVINEEAAERYFGGDAEGAAAIDGAGRRTTIVGVVKSALLRASLRAVEPELYLPIGEAYLSRMTLMIDVSRADDEVLAEIAERLDQVPGGGPKARVMTLDAFLSQTALAPERIATVLVGASAAMAVGLGVLGLYGAMAESTRQRRKEIALRRALGAQGWRVISGVLVEGARLAAAGSLFGLLGAVLVGRWLGRFMPDAAALAPWIWIAAPAVLGAVVAIASVVPARRALTVDPLSLLRDS